MSDIYGLWLDKGEEHKLLGVYSSYELAKAFRDVYILKHLKRKGFDIEVAYGMIFITQFGVDENPYYKDCAFGNKLVDKSEQAVDTVA